MKTYALPKHLVARAMRRVDDELYGEHLRGEFSEGDPNHPRYNDGYDYATKKRQLFGCEQDEFLARQYK